MLKYILGFLIFCIILFFYLHIQYHLKTSNELEIYEIEQASKDKLEEICDLRQPILFEDEENQNKIINGTNMRTLLNNYPVFEVKIRETNDYSIDALPLQLHIAYKLFDEDKSSKYFSENNSDFLNETGAIKSMKYNDTFLRPYLVSNCNYDIIFGSENVETPFRYEMNYRNFFTVTQGSIQIKLAPPKSIKYLYPINDYENFEFRSPINPWNVQNNYKADFDKIKCLEINLTPGKFLFIPAYWWYSFKFSKDTSVSCFRYRTYMNNIAISPTICMYALQNQNVERKIAKNIENTTSKNTIELNNFMNKNNFIDNNNNDNNSTISNNGNNNIGNVQLNDNMNNINDNISIGNVTNIDKLEVINI
jgi:hypothetical protein